MREINLTKDNFQNEVIKSTELVLIDFWASWCGPCRMLSPVIEEIANKYEGELKVCKVNVDDEPELADRFNVNSIPLLVLMKDGKIVNTSIGYKPMDQIESFIKESEK